jgi:hypothetical protein
MARKSRLAARYWSWVKRLGKKKALVALGHTLLRIVYHVLLKKQGYIELGPDYLDRFRQDREERRTKAIIRELEQKGFTVTSVA